MALDLAVVGLELQTDSLKAGETVAVSSFDRIEKSAIKVQSTVGATGKVFDDIRERTAKTSLTMEQARKILESTGASADFVRQRLEKMGFAQQAANAATQASIPPMNENIVLSKEMIRWHQAAAAATAQQTTARLTELTAVRNAIALKQQADERLVASQFAVASSAATVSGGIGGVGKAAAGTGTGLRTMATGLASLAASQLGLRAGLGSLIGAVGFFSLGSLTTLGVMAGLAAIAVGYNLITKDARESRKAIQDVIDKLDEQARAQHQTARLTRLQVQGEVQRVQAELATAQAIATARGSGEKGEAGQQQRAIVDVIRLTKELKDLEDTKRHADKAEASDKQSVRDKEVQQLVTVISLHKATKKDLEDRKQLIAEDTVALAKAGITLAERARLQSEINTLTKAGVEKTRAATGAIDAYADSIARARREARTGGLGSPVDTGAGFTGALTPETLRGMDKFDRRRKEAADKVKADDRERARLLDASMDAITYQAGQIPPLAVTIFGTKEEIRAATQRFEAALRTLTDSVQRAFADLFSGRNPFDSLVNLARQAAASMAAAFTVKSLGLDAFLKKITSVGSAGAGGFQGTGVSAANVGNAAVGSSAGLAALAGPIGVAAGIVGVFLSEISGGAARARAAAEAQKAYNLNLADFVAIAHPRGVLGDALAALTKQFEELATQAAAAAGVTTSGAKAGLSQADIQKELDSLKGIRDTASIKTYYEALLRLRKIMDENIEATKRLQEVERQREAEDRKVRELRATGDAAGADLLAFINAQARAFEDLKKSMGEEIDATEKAILANEAHTQSLEATAFAEQQAAAAAQKAFDNAQTSAGIEAQILQNLGKDKEAAAARQAIADATTLHDAQLLVDQGIITQQMFNDLADSMGVLAEATAAATAAAEAQAAFQKGQTARGIDAEIAGLTGDTAGAARINEDIRRAEERNRIQGLFDQGIISQKQFDDWNDAFTKSLAPVLQAISEQLGGGGGATQAFAAVSAVVTDRTALMLVDYTRQGVSLLSFLPKIEANTRGGGAGGGGTTINTSIRFASIKDATDEELDDLVQKINERLGRLSQSGQVAGGSVAR